jgi:capsular polysaccharide biosynthesis protein
MVSSAGYRVVHLERFTFKEQVEIMSEASAIIAPHGGGLANLLFCGRNAKVLELLSEAYLVGFFYRLARACDFAYSAYVGAADRAANGTHAWRIDRDNFSAALAEFEAASRR